MMRFFTTTDGVKLAYRDQGAGLPLLCLAGLTRNSGDFNFVAPHLQNTRLIRLDYRGRGQSARADPMTYTKEREALDVIELLDHLGLEKTAILGTSRGGMIATYLGLDHAHRLSGVCLNDIGPVVAPEGIEIINLYLGKPPPFKTYDEAAIARAQMPGFDGVPLARWQQDVRHIFGQGPDGLTLTYDPGLRVPFVAAAKNPPPDRWPAFDGLTDIPLALIRGENSNILSQKTTAEMRRRRPDMIFAEAKNRGHIPFLDEPESLSVIDKFLEQIK
jgi:pimeloyl-ACP methyl ester carboxylesterase